MRALLQFATVAATLVVPGFADLAAARDPDAPGAPTFSEIRRIIAITEKNTGLAYKASCDGSERQCWYGTMATNRGPILTRCWEKPDQSVACDGNFHRLLRGETASR